MTTSEMILSIGVTGITTAIVWVIKDKQKSDLDVFKETIKTLKDELTEKKAIIKELTDLLKSEQTDKKDCLKLVHELEIKEQIKNNEITLLKLKANDNSESNNY